MIIKSLEIQNFLGFGDKTSIELADIGLVSITGKNGSGKSSLASEALVWCLWGKTLRKLKAKNKVVNLSKGKDCCVSAYLEEEDKLYKITRTQEMSKTRKSNDLLVQCNNQEITLGTNDDTQNLINTIMGMSFETFSQSIMLSYRGESYCSMTDSGQKAILEDILNLSQISEAFKIVKVKLSEKQGELAINNSEYLKISDNYKDLTYNYTVLKVKSEQFEREKMAKGLDLQSKFDKINKQIVNINKEIDIDKLKIKITKINEGIKINKDKIKKVQEKYLEQYKKIIAAQAEGKAVKSKIIDELESLIERFSQFSNMSPIPCSNCLQNITVTHIEDCLDLFNNNQAKLKGLLAKTEEKIKQANEEESVLKVILKDKQDKLAENLKELEEKKNNTIELVNNHNYNMYLIVQLREQLASIKEEIEVLVEQENPFIDLFNRCEQDLKDITLKKELLELKLADLTNYIKHLSFWELGFSNKGLKSYILDNILPFLNNRVQYYADILSDYTMTIKFNTQSTLQSGETRENFQVEVINSNGSDAYGGNSDGEKKRADIAVGWALGDLAASRSYKSIKFKCVDEIFENLDAGGKESVLNLLNKELDKYSTILVITHDSEMQDYFSKVIEITKEDGFSKINYVKGL